MNWETLIAELQAAGMSQVVIGAAIGKSQAWVSAASQGHYDDLKWSDGQKLIALHSAKLGVGDTAPEPNQEAA